MSNCPSNQNADRLSTKLDVITDRLASIDVTLAEQHVSLKEHIRRTEILEGAVEPIKKHVAMVDGAVKFIGVIATVVGMAAAVFEAVKFMIGK